MRVIRGVGVVGAGAAFAEHAAALTSLADRLRLVAVAELDPSRRRAATDAAFVPFVTDDHRVLLERPEVDIVVVCTPPRDHERIVGDALASGKYVVCEKPLAPNLAAIDRLVALADETPGYLSTVYQWRYRPDIRRITHLVAGERLGPVMLGCFERLARVPAGHRGPGWWGTWAVAGGGAVMTQAIHEVDLMLQLFGDAVEVSAEMSTLCLDIESEDTCVATVRFASGVMASLFVSVATHESSTRISVIGRDASAHFPWRISATDARVRRQLLAESAAAVPDASHSVGGRAAAPSRRPRRATAATAGRARRRTSATGSRSPTRWMPARRCRSDRPMPGGRSSSSPRSTARRCCSDPSACRWRANANHRQGVTKADYDRRERRPAELARSPSAS